ncbi:MAG TPA: fimbrial protein [Luteibacter sp.]|uniref:fimbrial protein n=1 Tax=Luteibacter sp. TaxID=1886636 RepID=UPI002C069B8F|nr:fimbrial protein [Luteibacter sp.]HVI57159.1 fimbrial protein [Luteibacter sp.]
MPLVRIVRFAFLLSLASIPAPARAGCLKHPSQGGPQVLSFGTVNVPVDAAPGSVLAEKRTAGWTSPRFKCLYPTRTASLGLFTTPSGRGEGIYDTNVAGVGIRVYFHNSNYGELLVPDHLSIPFIFDAVLTDAHFRVQLIKTGDVDAGDALTSGTLARGGWDGQAQAWVDLTDTRVEPERPTCAFTSRSLVFPLGKVDGRELLVVGSSPWVSQALVSTGCRHATQILMSFSAAANEQDASLFKVGGASPATGVAVELRSDDPDTQAIPNSPSPLILPAVRDGHSYGFRARYRRVGQTVTAGEANTSIVVNVSYR